MLGVTTTVIIGLILLAVADWARRNRSISNELSRKSVHIIRGCVVASWPFFISYRWIIVAEVLFLTIVAVAHYLKLFAWLRDVGRQTLGEFLYPLGVIGAALLEPPAWIFAVAVLHLALADGLAAIVGTKYGNPTSFRIFGYSKSVIGLMTFWLVSLVILGTVFFVDANLLGEFAFPILLLLPPALAILESVSVWGVDNLVVPVAVALSLKLLI